MDIDSNDALTNINGFQNILEIGGLRVYYNELLENIDALSNLEAIGGDVWILNNPSINDLDGLSNVQTIEGAMQISGNPLIEHLDGLVNLLQVTKISITNSQGLESYCGIYPLLSSGDITNTSEPLFVHSNKLNPTKEDILAAGPCETPQLGMFLEFSDGTTSLIFDNSLIPEGMSATGQTSDNLKNWFDIESTATTEDENHMKISIPTNNEPKLFFRLKFTPL